LGYFKEVNGGKYFTLPHCWKDMKDCPKFQEGYEAYKMPFVGSNSAKDATVINLDSVQPFARMSSRVARLRGEKTTKTNMKHDSLALHLLGTLKDLYVEKGVSNEKKNIRTCHAGCRRTRCAADAIDCG
jgi:hypothetical protein